MPSGTLAPQAAHTSSHRSVEPSPEPLDHEQPHVTASRDRRAARRAVTEQSLRSAALDLAEEHGFDGFTVDEVAQRAGVSPRTFFNYFATKEDAVLADPSPVLGAMIDAFHADPSRSVTECVRAAIVAFLAASTRDERHTRRELALLESENTLRTALVSHYCAYERSLAQAIAERLDTSTDSDPLPLVLAASVVAAARVLLIHWSWSTDPTPSEHKVDELLGGLAAVLGDRG